MCLLVLAWQRHPRYRLILAANRDEFHERPTAPLSPWAPPDQAILAGRDLRAGGTWLAISHSGRFGALTNFREPSQARPDAPSRGELIPAYLRQTAAPGAYLEALAGRAAAYAGFNLLLGDERSLWYASNRSEGPFAQALAPGVYGLSNGLLDSPWPKLRRVRAAFEALVAHADPEPETLLALLNDRTQARSSQGPLTGVDPAWEQTLSAPFVVHPLYGTRCSTVLLASTGPSEPVRVIERTFDRQGAPTGMSCIGQAP